MDDILITRNNLQLINEIVQRVSQSFSLKDLGELHHFLRIGVSKTTQGLHLSQERYIKDLLHKAHMIDAKETPTPMVSSLQLSKYERNRNINRT